MQVQGLVGVATVMIWGVIYEGQVENSAGGFRYAERGANGSGGLYMTAPNVLKGYAIVTLVVLIIMVAFYVSPADAAYSQVYRYDAQSDSWEPIDITDPDNVDAYCTVLGGTDSCGNHFEHALQFTTRAMIKWINNPGRLTMSVEPLTDNIEILEDGLFEVPIEEYAAWRFEYLIENVSNDETMNHIVVFDSFGAELDVEHIEAIYHDNVVHGDVEVWSQGKQEKYFFNWDNFILKPGEWARLIVDVGLGKNPAGKQEYTSCTPCTEAGYALNSEGTLKYKKDSEPGYSTRKGYTFRVKVPCEKYLEITLSASSTDWYLRKPGDFYAGPLTGTVESSHLVVVSFSGFGDLVSEDHDATIPVFYALNTDLPDTWIPASDLNLPENNLVLDLVNEQVEWNLWQRVQLEMQRAGEYYNEGVITFTINNQ